MTLVSIIIPVYNSEDTITATLNSVINQTYKLFEIIIVNDGSTDNTEAFINKTIASHPEISIHYLSQKNKGVSAARNLGLKNAKGELIAFLDSDDLWDPGKLEKQINILEDNPTVDFLGTNRDGIKHKSFFGKPFGTLVFIPAKLLLYKNFFMTSSVLFKRKVLNLSYHFKEGFNYSEDLEFFLRIAKEYNCYLYNESMVDSVQGKHAYSEAGLGSNLWKMEKGELHNLKLGYKLNIINGLEYIFLYFYSLLKYLRRIIITKAKKL